MLTICIFFQKCCRWDNSVRKNVRTNGKDRDESAVVSEEKRIGPYSLERVEITPKVFINF